MNYYETLYIVHPALESGRLKDIISSMNDTFKSLDLNIIGIDVWGKKKLAYLIDKQKYGTYVLVQFESDGQSNKKLAFELETNPNILSHLTSRISEQEIKKDLPSLEEQIHGSKPIPKSKDDSSSDNSEKQESNASEMNNDKEVETKHVSDGNDEATDENSVSHSEENEKNETSEE